MKYIKSSKKVILNFNDTESEIAISKINIEQSSEKEYMTVTMSMYDITDNKFTEIKKFSDKYDRDKVNALTIDLIAENPSLGLFDLNEILMFKVVISIVNAKKETNTYLKLSAEDLIIEEL